MDAGLLRRAGGPVVVTALAGAVGREYRTAGDNGVRHFRALGADDVVVAPTSARTRRSARGAAPGEAAGAARRLAVRLLDALRSTGVDRVVTDLLAAGGSCRARAPAPWCCAAGRSCPTDRARPWSGARRRAGRPRLPHWSGDGRADWLRAVDETVPAGVEVLGVPEQSGVLVEGGALTPSARRRRRCCAPVGASSSAPRGGRREARGGAVGAAAARAQRRAARVARQPGRRPPRPPRTRRREPGLFVHGLGGSATNWTDLMGLLEGVIGSEAVDLPGFGHSPPARRSTVGAHARAVIGHLEGSGRGPGAPVRQLARRRRLDARRSRPARTSCGP
jgi:hypothetical protein